MKTAMKLTTGILAMAVMAGGAWAQNPDAIDNARSVAKSLQQQQTTAKPAPGAPAPAVKPAAIPQSKPVTVASAAPAKAVSAAMPKAVTSSAANKLQRVTVAPNGDSIAIEITSSEAVTPRVSKLSSPARVVVELPETVVASSQNKIPVDNGGVKGVRVGMDGKNPPTTSVVVDLEKALPYEITPGPAGKLVLTLHTQGAAPQVAKAVPVKKEVKPAAQPQIVAKAVPVAKPAPAKAEAAKAVASAPKPAAPKQQAKTVVAAKVAPAVASGLPELPVAKPAPKPEDKKWAMTGKRDPFFSPVVQQQGSSCSTGKKCLEIGAINLRGVVKSDTGFIAVVTNNLNKAYFLRENDPVFNGFVVKITGDSVTFQEQLQDKLGKPFTREVIKKIFTPAV